MRLTLAYNFSMFYSRRLSVTHTTIQCAARKMTAAHKNTKQCGWEFSTEPVHFPPLPLSARIKPLLAALSPRWGATGGLQREPKPLHKQLCVRVTPQLLTDIPYEQEDKDRLIPDTIHRPIETGDTTLDLDQCTELVMEECLTGIDVHNNSLN